MKHQPVTLDTVGALIEHDHRVRVYCEERGCDHSDWLDLLAIRDKYGPDFNTLFPNLKPLLKCTKCGSRNCSVRLHPPTGLPEERWEWDG